MEIKTVGIEEIRPFENNPRNNDMAVDKVASSIDEFGWKQPIVVDKDGVIIVGHTRYKAALQLGYTEVPVLYAGDLSPEQVKAYRLADNKTSEFAEWNLDMLGAELKELDDMMFDMSQFGFEEWAEVEPEEDGFDVDAALEEITEPVSKLGDIWRLGRHRLMCGDAMDKPTVNALMDTSTADLVFTDPPWNVDYGASTNPKWKNGKDRQIMNDAMSTEQFAEFLNKAFAATHDICKEGCMVYVVMSAQEWGSMMKVMADTGYHWSSTIIWVKDSLVLSRKDYHTQYEPIWYGWKDGARMHPLVDRKQSDVWEIERPRRSDEHPTMKPIELMSRAMQNSSKSGDIVVDLFGGSGSTMIAAEQTNRCCCMMELDPKYTDVIIKRWETYTGEKAVGICREETRIHTP